MFDNLRQAFREAVDNFKDELNRDEAPDVVDGLLRQMQEEVVDTKAHLRALEEQIGKALRMAEVEGKEVATCRRREGMARKIGDDETARLAAEYAEKHERRREIQEGKVRALREELEMKRQEVEEMMAQLKEARARRESLTATLGRASARDSMTGADDLFSEMDRLAEEIEGIDRQREAEEDLLAELDGPGERNRRAEPSPEETAEDRLRELKRRMAEES